MKWSKFNIAHCFSGFGAAQPTTDECSRGRQFAFFILRMVFIHVIMYSCFKSNYTKYGMELYHINFMRGIFGVFAIEIIFALM
jgi:hypothetical protein